MDQLDGNRPLPFHRDALGRMVRTVWVRWAQTQPSPKPSWLLPYDELSEPDKEADRQIGEAIARWTLIGDAARAALDAPLSYLKNSGWSEVSGCLSPPNRPITDAEWECLDFLCEEWDFAYNPITK